MRYLPQSSGCFVCGKDNACGLRQRFRATDSGVETLFQAEERYCGYPGVVHGGIIAALLDETMGWASAVAKRHFFVTADLRVRYILPLPEGQSFTVMGSYLGDKVGLWLTKGEILGMDGMVYATGEGKFAPAPSEANDRFLAEIGKGFFEANGS